MKYIKFYRHLLPFWKIEAGLLLLSCLTMLMGLINPYLTKLVIDKAYGNRDMNLFIKLVSLGAIVFILTNLLGVLSNYLIRYINLRVNFNLKRFLFRKLQKLPYRFFQNTPSGENLYKISYDLEQVSHFISDSLPQAISLIPKSIFIFIIAFHLNFRMALFALALAPFSYIAPVYFNRALTKFYKMTVESSQGIFKRLSETLSHMRLVKASGRGERESKEYAKDLIKNMKLNLANTRLQAASSFANALINKVVLGLIIFYGGYQVTKGLMTLGNLTAITLYLNQLIGLLGSIAHFFQQASMWQTSCDRVDIILESPPDFTERKDAKEIIFPKGEIEFRNVAFGYEPHKLVLAGLNFRIRGGSRVALVGFSGCGKTTIVNLIARLYNLDSGQVLVDGNDIREIRALSFYKQIGIAMQEPNLWNDTIENNIKYGKEGAGLDEVVEAARISCADEFISGFPKGYTTVIGENACRISEGQKQRIAIARALIKKPKILILDEAMSAIDSETEDRIINNIKRGLGSPTLIVVSHRLATVEKMDLVYFLTHPSSIESGLHEDLVRKSPEYNGLFLNQIVMGKREEVMDVL